MWNLAVVVGAMVCGPFVLSLGLTCGVVLFEQLAPQRWKRAFSLGPMGIRNRSRPASGRRTPKPHGVLMLPEVSQHAHQGLFVCV